MIYKYVTEIRFKPDPEFLDMRGKIASSFVDSNFPIWAIDKDSVRLSNSEKDELYITFRNLGLSTFNKEKIPVYTDKIYEAIDRLNSPMPIRWGVRFLCLFPSRKKFNNLVREYKEAFLNFNPAHFRTINGELIDMAVSYIFKKNNDKFHLSFGPMQKEQAKEIFPFSKLPARGLFVDLDIYRDEHDFSREDFKRKRVKEFIKGSFEIGDAIIANFLKQTTYG